MGLGWWFTPYDAERDREQQKQRRAERDREQRRKRAEKEAKRHRERAARPAPVRAARPAPAASRRAVVVRPKAAPAAPAAPATAKTRRSKVAVPKAAPAAPAPAKNRSAGPLMSLDTATSYARKLTKNAPGGTFTAAQMGHAVERWHVQAHSVQGADNVDRAKSYAKAQTGAVLARLQASKRIERSGAGFRAR